MAAITGDLGSERISEANVVLQLIDANDNAPVFDQERYQVSISEDVLPLTNVVTVHAEDADTGDYGHVSYSLQGEGSREFMVDQESGLIQVKKGPLGRSSLDRELTESYNLRVVATDLPGENKL